MVSEAKVSKRAEIAAGILLTIVMGGIGALAEEQPGIDPQSLVGEWVGSWTATSVIGGPPGGPYKMTIRRIEGPRVFGHVEISRRRQVEFDFVGTLDGKRLT